MGSVDDNKNKHKVTGDKKVMIIRLLRKNFGTFPSIISKCDQRKLITVLK